MHATIDQRRRSVKGLPERLYLQSWAAGEPHPDAPTEIDGGDVPHGTVIDWSEWQVRARPDARGRKVRVRLGRALQL